MLVSGDRHSPLEDSGPQSLSLLCPALLRKAVEPPCSFARGLQIPHGKHWDLAEGVGFEPTVLVRGRQFSRLVHSTALPPLRGTRIARASYCKARVRSSRRAIGPIPMDKQGLTPDQVHRPFDALSSQRARIQSRRTPYGNRPEGLSRVLSPLPYAIRTMEKVMLEVWLANTGFL